MLGTVRIAVIEESLGVVRPGDIGELDEADLIGEAAFIV
jgi:hypothetical protein